MYNTLNSYSNIVNRVATTTNANWNAKYLLCLAISATSDAPYILTYIRIYKIAIKTTATSTYCNKINLQQQLVKNNKAI